MFFFVETSNNTCVTKIWTPPLPAHAHRQLLQAVIFLFSFQIEMLTKIWTPLPAHAHRQLLQAVTFQIEILTKIWTPPPCTRTQTTITSCHFFISDRNFNNYMQAVYTDVQTSKVPHNGAYPIDTCNVLEAVQNLNEGDAKAEEQHCREAAAQGLVDMQEGQCATQKSKSSSQSHFAPPPPLQSTGSKLMFVTHRVSAEEDSD